MATPSAPPVPQPLPAVGNGIATAGLVCGILGILLCWLAFVGLILGLLGIIFGAIGMSRAGKLGGKGKGAAVAGLVCGILSFFFTFVMAAVAIPAFLDYMKKGKKTESTLHLQRLEMRIKAYYNEMAQLPPSASLMPGDPMTACATGDGKLAVRSQAEWFAAGWRPFAFHIDEPARYAVRWTVEQDGQQHSRDQQQRRPSLRTRGYLEALADLDCDGTVSTTRVDIEIDGGSLRVTRHDPTPD